MAELTVRVIPRSSCRRVEVGPDGCIKVRVPEAPVDGAANEAVLTALAEALGVKRRFVSLVRGHTSRTKVVEVEGMTLAEVEAKLAQT